MVPGINRRTTRWHYYPRLAQASLVAALAAHIMPPLNSPVDGQWALRYLQADQVWKITNGSGIGVAVIDTGVMPSDNLSTRLLVGADYSNATGNSIGNGHIDTDVLGHGTGEASLIAGSGSLDGKATRGLAPGSAIIPVRVSDGSTAEVAFSLAPAIEYATTHGAQVINLAIFAAEGFGSAWLDPP